MSFAVCSRIGCRPGPSRSRHAPTKSKSPEGLKARRAVELNRCWLAIIVSASLQQHPGQAATGYRATTDAGVGHDTLHEGQSIGPTGSLSSVPDGQVAELIELPSVAMTETDGMFAQIAGIFAREVGLVPNGPGGARDRQRLHARRILSALPDHGRNHSPA